MDRERTLLFERYSGSTFVGSSQETTPAPTIVIVPHPDDEAFGFSGTLSTIAAAGSPVRVYLATGGAGSKGGVEWVAKHKDNPAFDLNGDGVVNRLDHAIVRKQEFLESLARVFRGRAVETIFVDEYLEEHEEQTTVTADVLARVVADTCAASGFPLGPHTRVITVAAVLGTDEQAQFYGEVMRGNGKEHPLHRTCAVAAAKLCEQNTATDTLPANSVSPDNVYLFKVYQHGARSAPVAPLRVVPSKDSASARQGSIHAYDQEGRRTAPRLFKSALKNRFEYAATLGDIQAAGYELKHDR